MDMHSELLKKIYDLPAIIQGALGSFVFAILAFLVQRFIQGIRFALGQTSEAFIHRLRPSHADFRSCQWMSDTPADSPSACPPCITGGLTRCGTEPEDNRF
jgi:hypothetical protein